MNDARHPLCEPSHAEDGGDVQMTKGQIAYHEAKGGLTHDGKVIPPWPSVGPEVRAAWEAAAVAVVGCSVDEAIARAQNAAADLPNSREKALVLTRLEEAEMWAARRRRG